MDKKFLTPKKQHPLIKVWNNYPELLKNENTMLSVPSIERIIGEVFAPGRFYHYIINFADSTIYNHHEDILKIHGLSKYPAHLKEIIDLIHPDDIEFVMEAERMCMAKMIEIDASDRLSELKFQLLLSDENFQRKL